MNPAATVPEVVDHLFRHEAGRMVAVLTRIFGTEHFGLAEDVVQEALSRALQTWPYHGVPENPSAWLLRTARNLALDVVRRRQVFREKEAEIVHLAESFPISPCLPDADGPEIADDHLRLIFVCCHPLVPEEAQAALVLKAVCGFGVSEIARAFLTTDAAVEKRLTRAKQRIREAGIPFEIPSGPELSRRLDGVLRSLYLLFNEGYKASSGAALVREEVCLEAIRLADLLSRHPAGDHPPTHALLALMLLNGARTPARTDGGGNLCLLREQDRTQWDRAMIARGFFQFARSAAGDHLGEYHLQAAIAACHCAAPDYASTDWERILSLYDLLIGCDGSPVVALNRAVALANHPQHGPRAGLAAVDAIGGIEKLEGYYLLYAVRGEFLSRLGRRSEAAEAFRRALALAGIQAERDFLARRLRECGGDAPS